MNNNPFEKLKIGFKRSVVCLIVLSGISRAAPAQTTPCESLGSVSMPYATNTVARVVAALVVSKMGTSPLFFWFRTGGGVRAVSPERPDGGRWRSLTRNIPSRACC